MILICMFNYGLKFGNALAITSIIFKQKNKIYIDKFFFDCTGVTQITSYSAA